MRLVDAGRSLNQAASAPHAQPRSFTLVCMSEQLPQPGWYHNSRGQTQWWDGTAWGMLAEDYVPAHVPAQPEHVPAQPEQVQAAAVQAPAEQATPEQVPVEQASEPLQGTPVADVAGPAQPVAQDFSREFLEQRYGAGAQPTVTPAATPAPAPAVTSTPAPAVTPTGTESGHSVPGNYSQHAQHNEHSQQNQHSQYSYAQPTDTTSPSTAQSVHGGFHEPSGLHAPSGLHTHNSIGSQSALNSPSSPKPLTHMFTWISFAAAAVALLSAIVAGSYFMGVLFGLAWLAILAATVFGIIAIIQSQKKVLPVVATAVAATGFVWVPVIQIVAAFTSFNSNFYSM